MEDTVIATDDTACEPAVESADVPASENVPEGEAPAPETAPPSLEEMVRSEVERRIAEMFPARRETPRNSETPATQIKSEDRLRLGYGSREPHT